MLTLRPTTADDVPELTTWEADPDTSIWLCEIGSAWHLRALDDPEQDHLLALDDATPVGFAVLAGLDGDGSVELRRMVVTRAHRGSGRGRALLTTVLDHAFQRHGANSVWLDVKAHNCRARTLYESEGFTFTETVVDAITEPDGTMSDLIVLTRRPR